MQRLNIKGERMNKHKIQFHKEANLADFMAQYGGEQ
jgi:hypothetical protein